MTGTRLRTVRIFGSPQRAWLFVTVYILLLYGTGLLTLQAYLWFYDRLGREAVEWTLNSVFAVVGVGLIVLCRPRRPAALLTLALVAVALAYCAAQIDVPANRLHFAQYAPLTLLVFDALRFRVSERDRYPLTVVLVTLVGIGDEFVQSLSAGRVFDVHDIVLNGVAAVLTLAVIGFVWEEDDAVVAVKRPSGS